MTLYAIDPGTEQSALVRLAEDGAVTGWLLDNDELRKRLRAGCGWPAHMVIEQIESYGMAVGRDVFETVFWSGRFAEAWQSYSAVLKWSRLPRRAVKLHLCGSPRAKDANIRQALIDRYGGPQSIKKGGPLHGIKSHLWAALALAVTYQDLHGAPAQGTEEPLGGDAKILPPRESHADENA